MKICLINGSPKLKDSCSTNIIQSITAKLSPKSPEPSQQASSAIWQGISSPVDQECVRYETANGKVDALLDAIDGCEIIVIVFPLYVDGIPSHLLRLLYLAEERVAQVAPDARLYVISQNGFYEAHQNRLAIEMMRNFVRRAKLTWGQGIGVGGGPMVNKAPIGYGPNKNLGLALDTLTENIVLNKSADDIFVTPNFPRFLYLQMAHLMWRRLARQNKVTKQSLWNR
ncbi:MAG: NAD(P)H-dependent oxidoreductase [Lachnospiraceae bacterium]|jgi:NAD(P)H-dependent FMN reductase|nr:NAD(P)H-dependent oxidoreductase [Lachnospiraceae bacterium]